MAGHSSPEQIRQETRKYLVVFAALATLTIVTVAVSYLKLPHGAAVALALLIASVKGSLVACYFMHLIDERRVIYALLGLTAVFFLALIFLPMGSFHWQVVAE